MLRSWNYFEKNAIEVWEHFLMFFWQCTTKYILLSFSMKGEKNQSNDTPFRSPAPNWGKLKNVEFCRRSPDICVPYWIICFWHIDSQNLLQLSTLARHIAFLRWHLASRYASRFAGTLFRRAVLKFLLVFFLSLFNLQSTKHSFLGLPSMGSLS